jgi:hypothetical protein
MAANKRKVVDAEDASLTSLLLINALLLFSWICIEKIVKPTDLATEAIDVVKQCPKILVKYEHGYTFLSRREQGYIPPEKPKVVDSVPEEV